MPIARLDSRALISVTGEDAKPFLHNLLTQDVETLAEGAVRYGALLSPPGRLLFDLFILGEAGGVLLDVAADRREALLTRLSMYRLRAKVAIEAVEMGVARGTGSAPAGAIADPRDLALAHFPQDQRQRLGAVGEADEGHGAHGGGHIQQAAVGIGHGAHVRKIAPHVQVAQFDAVGAAPEVRHDLGQ